MLDSDGEKLFEPYASLEDGRLLLDDNRSFRGCEARDSSVKERPVVSHIYPEGHAVRGNTIDEPVYFAYEPIVAFAYRRRLLNQSRHRWILKN